MKAGFRSRAEIEELLARYDRPGPRYTSYPTAVEFHERFRERDLHEKLRKADALGEAPLSVYTHLPFCEERCLFCGCHVIISPRKKVPEQYIERLEKEMTLLAERLPHRRRVAQLHLGGGTPTYHRVEELRRLMERFCELFELIPGAEVAVEADPRVTSTEQLEALASWGFNRISFGVQDFTERVQEAVHRVQSVEQTLELARTARRLGFRGLNIDLIYGLPYQQVDSFEKTVEEVIALGADRVAVYSFAFVPWMKGHQKNLPRESFPDRSLKFSLFAAARERFLDAGYVPIGMDHFARPTDELAVARKEGRLFRNFMGYTVMPGHDTLGLGISAIADIRGAYVQNEKKIITYNAAIDAGRLPVHKGLERSRDDEIRGAVIQSLMCNFRVNPSLVEKAFGIDFSRAFHRELQALEPYEKEGLVEVGKDEIRATGKGQLFIRNLAMCFDAYLEHHDQGDQQVFSRTV